jgi:hypothetical protein
MNSLERLGFMHELEDSVPVSLELLRLFKESTDEYLFS